MQQYEYRVVPAPKRGTKQRGLKTAQDRFAFALTELMNQMAREGWEYQRADALPCEEKVGLTGRVVAYHNLLVFRRALPVAQVQAQPLAHAQPDAVRAEGGRSDAGRAEALPPLRLGPAQTDAGAAPAVGGAMPQQVAAQ